MMKDVIHEVISVRKLCGHHKPSDGIRLSGYFMSKFMQELGISNKSDFHHMGENLVYAYNGEQWRINCIPYRDDSNDQDVEEAIYKIYLNHINL